MLHEFISQYWLHNFTYLTGQTNRMVISAWDLFPFLNSGVTFAVLQSRGMQPVSSDLWKIVAIGLAISLLIFLSRRDDKLSSPEVPQFCCNSLWINDYIHQLGFASTTKTWIWNWYTCNVLFCEHWPKDPFASERSITYRKFVKIVMSILIANVRVWHDTYIGLEPKKSFKT